MEVFPYKSIRFESNLTPTEFKAKLTQFIEKPTSFYKPRLGSFDKPFEGVILEDTFYLLYLKYNTRIKGKIISSGNGSAVSMTINFNVILKLLYMIFLYAFILFGLSYNIFNLIVSNPSIVLPKCIISILLFSVPSIIAYTFAKSNLNTFSEFVLDFFDKNLKMY